MIWIRFTVNTPAAVCLINQCEYSLLLIIYDGFICSQIPVEGSVHPEMTVLSSFTRSCCSKPVWLSVFCWIQKKIFWKILYKSQGAETVWLHSWRDSKWWENDRFWVNCRSNLPWFCVLASFGLYCVVKCRVWAEDETHSLNTQISDFHKTHRHQFDTTVLQINSYKNSQIPRDIH